MLSLIRVVIVMVSLHINNTLTKPILELKKEAKGSKQRMQKPLQYSCWASHPRISSLSAIWCSQTWGWIRRYRVSNGGSREFTIGVDASWFPRKTFTLPLCKMWVHWWPSWLLEIRNSFTNMLVKRDFTPWVIIPVTFIVFRKSTCNHSFGSFTWGLQALVLPWRWSRACEGDQLANILVK